MAIAKKVTLMVFFVISFFVIISNNSVVNAEEGSGSRLSPPEYFISSKKINPEYQTDASKNMTSVVNRLLGFLQIASALIAVVMIAVTGFRYIIETPEMKNELKKSMIPIIVGILLVFFATSIARFFIGMFKSGN